MNAQGEGAASGTASVSASTRPGTPSVNPPVVSATGDFGRATRVNASWGAVGANAEGTGVVYDYVVTSRSGGEARGETDATSVEVDVSGWRIPLGGTDITVTVQARTAVSGQTLRSDVGSRTANVGRWGSPPSVPGTPSVVADGTRLTASWTAPAVSGGSDLEAYLVTWQVPGRRDVQRQVGAGTTQDVFDVADVPPGTVVTVQVRARNGSGTSEPATATYTTPAAPDPDPGGDG